MVEKGFSLFLVRHFLLLPDTLQTFTTALVTVQCTPAENEVLQIT